MMRAFMIVLTALLSRLFLERKYYRHHFLGLILIIIGLCLVGTFSFLHSKNSGKGDKV